MHKHYTRSICRCVISLAAALTLSFSALIHAQDTQDQPMNPDTAKAVESARADGKSVVELKTNLGSLFIALEDEKAPKSVENFLAYVKDDFYNGTVFHRVIEGFMIQGGGMDLRLEKKETKPPVQNEADNGLKNKKFTVAMARTGNPHSATAQFFINTADNHFLDHKSKTQSGWGYTVIGKLIGGERLAEWISKAPTGPAGPFPSDVPEIPLVIEKAGIL